MKEIYFDKEDAIETIIWWLGEDEDYMSDELWLKVFHNLGVDVKQQTRGPLRRLGRHLR